MKKKVYLFISAVMIPVLSLPGIVFGGEITVHFNDVPKNQWYYNDVYNVVERGMFNGTAFNSFSPDGKMTRGMYLTVLYRMSGSPAVEYGTVFDRIRDSLYYKNAMIFADNKKLLPQNTYETFDPEKPLTREEMVYILDKYRTCDTVTDENTEYNRDIKPQSEELNPDSSEIPIQTDNPAVKNPENNTAASDMSIPAELAIFTDAGLISEYAMDSFVWAVNKGIINGKESDIIAPSDNCTRAEVSAVLMRYRTKEMGDSYNYYRTGTSPVTGEVLSLPNTTANYWFGSASDSLNRPNEPMRIMDVYGDKYNVLSIDKNVTNRVYLTFDEGYENGYTGRILDILKEKNVKAVFFVTGQYAKQNPTLISRMINEGHIVGNHSNSHPEKGMPSLSPDAQVNDIEALQNILRTQYGYEMTLFRYPAGTYSEQSLMLVKNMGLKSVFWSFAYYDYDVKKQPSASSALSKLNSALHPGAVYLLHAVSDTNASILGNFIDHVRNMGYEFSLIYN